MADALTECIRVLVGRGVVRDEQLEILLLLAREPERRWTPRAVAEGVAAAPEHAGPILAGLASRGLLSIALDDAAEDAYRLDGRLDVGALQALRSTFTRDRTRVTEALRTVGRAEFRAPTRASDVWRSI